MQYSNIVVVPRQSKLQWQFDQGLSRHQALQTLEQQGFSTDTILADDQQLQRGLQAIQRLMPGIQVIPRQQFTAMPVGAQAAISLGGDGHCLFVARRLNNQVLIGINANPDSSAGVLLPFDVTDLDQLARQLANDTFQTVPRARLRLRLDGQDIPFMAMSEIYLGQQQSLLASHTTIAYDGQSFEQKHAGIVVTTGTGASGWARGITQHWPQPISPQSLSPAQSEAQFVVREVHGQGLDQGRLWPGQTLTIASHNSHGIVALDADPSDPQTVLPFLAGSLAEISLADQPLRLMQL